MMGLALVAWLRVSPSLTAQIRPGRITTVALTVAERAGVARAGWPLVSGVPFGRGALREEEIQEGHYRVLDASGREVPSQATVSATWGRYPEGSSGDVKWIRLVFAADVPAGGSARYRLEAGPGVKSDVTTELAVEEAGPGVTVTTGAAEDGSNLRVRFGGGPGDLLEGVWLDGDGDGFQEAERIVSPAVGQFRLSYRYQGRRCEVALDDVTWQVEVEQAGPVEVVVKASSRLDEPTSSAEAELRRPRRRMELLVRAYAYVGWPVLHLQPTLIYRGDPSKETDWVELEEFSYRLPLRSAGSSTVVVGTGDAYRNERGPDVTVALGGGRAVEVEQDVHHHFQRDHVDGNRLSQGASYRVVVVGEEAAKGTRAPGWVLVSDDGLSVVGWCRYFWQLFPKRIVVDDTGVTYQLWAKGAEFEPAGCQRFYKGMAKTHDLFFRFDGGALSAEEAGQFARALRDELIAGCEPAYYCATQAYGPHPLSPAVSDGTRLHPGYDELVRWCLNRELSSGLGLYPWRERQDAYGFLNFGDWLLSGYWASHEYDTIWGLLEQFYRTGELELVDYVREAARHSYDIDFHHNFDLTSSGYPQTSHDKDNFHFEGGASHGHTGEADPGHVFVDGLLNYYWLTGDLRAGDVLEWSFPLYLAEQKERLCGGGTWRYVGGHVVGIYMRAYEWTWDPAYTSEAEWAVANNFYPEQPGGGNSTRHVADGVWWDRRGDGYSCQPWLGDSVVDGYSALIAVHPRTLYRQRLEEAFVQIARFVDAHAFDREEGGIWQGLAKPGLAAGPYEHSRSNYGRGICGLSALTMGAAYELTGDPHFLAVGRELLGLLEQCQGRLYHGKEVGQALHYTPMLIYYLDSGDSAEAASSPARRREANRPSGR
jgi:hypothetical protein